MIRYLSLILGGIFSVKSFFAGFMVICLGIIFYNLAAEILQEVLNFAISQVSGTSFETPANPSFSGFAGWFLGQLKIPECISVFVSAVAIRFILKKIPFINW